jgi:hypothetical protein
MPSKRAWYRHLDTDVAGQRNTHTIFIWGLLGAQVCARPGVLGKQADPDTGRQWKIHVPPSEDNLVRSRWE